MANWRISEPERLELDGMDGGRVDLARVRIVSGHVDIVATDGPAVLEVAAIDGPPLDVTLENGELVVTHEKLTWGGVLDWGRSMLGGTRMGANLSLRVPAAAAVELAVVSADAVVSGLEGRASVRSVSGDVVLDGLSGGADAQTVSGDLETRSLRGDLAFETVSGDLTVVESGPGEVRAKSVSGSLTVDLAETAGDLSISTVSGDVTVRMPEGSGMRVDVKTTSGDLSAGFDGLVRERKPGKSAMSGVLGAGAGRLKVKTVSGDVTLLERR